MDTLYDMHCHLGFTPDPARTAVDAAARGIGVLSCTVTPAEYVALAPQLASVPNVHVALGAHPWWIADGRIDTAQLDLFCQLAPAARFIGEIGLDFAGPRDTAESRALQTPTLQRLLEACTAAPRAATDSPIAANASDENAAIDDAPASGTRPLPKLISLHAVNAAGEVLDALDAADTLARHQVIFHWFSGTSDDLQRALRAGCFFSVGPRMLASRRGREYARQIPLDRLLLETDMPTRAGTPLPPEVWRAELNNALTGIAQLKSIDPPALATQLAATSETLLAPTNL